MAEEQGAFAFDDVAATMVDKMVRRHPHVFAGKTYADVAEQTAAWDAIKAQERAGKNRATSLLDDVPASLPGLTRAVKLTKRAARAGFDWPSTAQVMAKLREELQELQDEIDAGDLPKARAELGDVGGGVLGGLQVALAGGEILLEGGDGGVDELLQVGIRLGVDPAVVQRALENGIRRAIKDPAAVVNRYPSSSVFAPNETDCPAVNEESHEADAAPPVEPNAANRKAFGSVVVTGAMRASPPVS
jgi:NTP pyrophosphatase (non-canonical NTP hydrolase)